MPGRAGHHRIEVAARRIAGWSRVLFLDDDMVRLKKADIAEAATRLGTCNAVGLSRAGFPDNSVVCHAYRRCGGDQDGFAGAGALAGESPADGGPSPRAVPGAIMRSAPAGRCAWGG